MTTLRVFISEDCWSCCESRRIIGEIAPQFPQITIELVDLSAQKRPDEIFAVPTYVLDGKVISLGNPYLTELQKKLQDALSGV